MKYLLRFAVILLVLIPFLGSAQKKDSLFVAPEPLHKNVIKFNPTPMMLWSKKNLTFSYERILNRKQSIAITLGYLEFPKLFSDTIARIVTITDRQKQGINVALEYRFYLMKRNVRPIPDGIYIAPFFSYYGYAFTNKLSVINSQAGDFAKIDGRFFSFNLGFELGYQFVFWKRLTLDMVLIGPATSYYGGKVDISGNVDLEQIKDINEDVYNKIKEKYPMVDNVMIDKTFIQDGKLDLFSVGYRYLIQIGYHF